jgi:RNA polymerase sigma factor (sigma-70 family)
MKVGWQRVGHLFKSNERRFCSRKIGDLKLVFEPAGGQIKARSREVDPGTFCTLMSLTDDSSGGTAGLKFEILVERYYRPLYQFAFSLTQSESDACDLTQQTFYIWATKGHQLRDASKVKTWLFTSLHREFLESRRRQTRFPHHELSQVDFELPAVAPARVNQLDSAQVLQALAQVDQIYQAPVALFYLEDHSYKEIAEILDAPMGTVKSRIARGIAQLQKLLSSSSPGQSRKGAA